jgi:hypothetical protein
MKTIPEILLDVALLSTEEKMELLEEIAFSLNMTVISDHQYDDMCVTIANHPG